MRRERVCVMLYVLGSESLSGVSAAIAGGVGGVLCVRGANSVTSQKVASAEIKGQGPGLVNVLLAATHSNPFTTSALRRETRLLGWQQQNVHQSWLLALNRPRS